MGRVAGIGWPVWASWTEEPVSMLYDCKIVTQFKPLKADEGSLN